MHHMAVCGASKVVSLSKQDEAMLAFTQFRSLRQSKGRKRALLGMLTIHTGAGSRLVAS